MRAWLLAVLLASSAAAPAAEQTFQAPEQFILEAFVDGTPPAPQVLWLTGALAADIDAILGHAPAALRQRYWRDGERTAWILEEIGKEQPITAGFVVETGALRTARVLIYRESRGWEVRHDFFTRQFVGSRLRPDHTLDTRIDNISGATLSVNALQRLARVALRLHAQVTAP